MGPFVRGDFVRNVHPCNAGRVPDGVVEGVEPGTGSVSVRTGRGSHVYGPMVNWVRVDAMPGWLVDELEQLGVA